MASDSIFSRLAKLEKEQKDAKASHYVKVVRKMIDDAILQRIYPVGSIITKFDESDPGETIGGRWERFARGRMILGADNTVEAGLTGGRQNITITEKQLPSHDHKGTTDQAGGDDIPLKGYGSTLGAGNAGWRFGASGGSIANGIAKMPNHTHKFTTEKTGGGEAIDIMPPYVTAYIWRRIE